MTAAELALITVVQTIVKLVISKLPALASNPIVTEITTAVDALIAASKVA